MKAATSQPDPVIAALDAQVACYRRLAQLAEQQRELVRQGSTDELLQLLTIRQTELDQLASHEQVSSPARGGGQPCLATLAADDRARAEALIIEARLLLERITAADSDDLLVLQQLRLNLGRQLRQAPPGRAVNRAYAANAYLAKSAKLTEKT